METVFGSTSSALSLPFWRWPRSQCLFLPVLYISLGFPQLPWQESEDWSFATVCFACLQKPPLKLGIGSGSSVVPAGVPVWSTILLPLGGRQECLIPILWPGFCCVPQIVYVMCSAHLSWCYFIPAVSTKMTKLFMYSQLIVTCLWSVPAQKKTNKQTKFFQF